MVLVKKKIPMMKPVPLKMENVKENPATKKQLHQKRRERLLIIILIHQYPKTYSLMKRKNHHHIQLFI